MIKCSSVYTQDEITLDEGLSAEVCGKIVVFDGIWMSEGKQKVDISVLESENSKPITGGYAMYDKININGCVYYISGIFKNGIKPAGKLKLSKNKPERVDKIMFTKVEIANNSKLYNNDPLSKIKIVRGSTGKPVIKTKYIENDVEIILTVGSVIWFEGYPFELTKISLEYKIAEFLIMKTYFYE